MGGEGLLNLESEVAQSQQVAPLVTTERGQD